MEALVLVRSGKKGAVACFDLFYVFTHITSKVLANRG